MSSGAAEGKVLQGGSIMSPGLAGAVSDETTPKSGGGGGLFDYLISRKLHNNNNNKMSTPPSKSSDHAAAVKRSKREERMQNYHRLANAAGSQYFGSLAALPLFHDDSDSDHDDNTNATKFSAAAAATSSIAPSLRSHNSDNDDISVSSPKAKFWLAKFQKQEKQPPQPHETNRDEVLKTDTTKVEQSSSWMNKAWQTVDSATEWMASSPSSAEQSSSSSSASWWTVPSSATLSNAISSIVVNIPNPFKDDSESISNNTNYNHSTTSSSSSNQYNNASNNNKTINKNTHLLPLIASRFEWATKRRNPYQAVIGRVDTDYYLLSGGRGSGGIVNLWGLISLRWLIPNVGNRNGNNTGENGADGCSSNNRVVGTSATTTGEESMLMRRRKSLPSEASVMALQNLLALVQQQQQQQQQHDEHLQQQEQYQYQQMMKSSPQQPRKMPSSPLLAPFHHSPSVESFTPRSPSIQPFPDNLRDSSSFESDHSPLNHYPSPRMTPVQSFQASPKHLQPPPLTLPKSASSPVIKRRSTSLLQDSSIVHTSDKNMNTSGSNNQVADAEMAARLAEGTLRAYRDLALDEATELHSALHHWTLRWERPFLGWLEAGPTVWFSGKGYSPYSAGKKVSQIQAVLARRCAVIGEIQQHLWRANWQRGVAEWGMLGHGQGEWASVMLEHGDMTDISGTTPGPTPPVKQQPKRMSMKIFNHSSFVGGNVSNSRGGQILVDEDALTTWSIDGIKVVRDQLYRAGPAGAQLPYYENWPNEVRHFDGDNVGHSDEIDHPSWATNGAKTSDKTSSKIVISDLPGMADEVSALLQSIELNLDQQRQRRLNKLRPPSNLRRHWYMIALGIPTAAYTTYLVCKKHGGYFLLKEVLNKIGMFYKEHVSEPLTSIYQELFTKTGRIDVNDRKARIDTIESLKRMIRSWLDETFADMPEAEKIAMSNNMDISLIEQLKEESIKHIYEINSVVRCSLIEMQFIKKELLNALVAMDELMGSNEINMRIAAMTPAVILMIAVRKVFRVIFYALFKFGASKQEIYACFKKTILDMERLLLMRDNPPPVLHQLSWGSTRHVIRSGSVEADDIENRQTLSAADLGMLLLHIHECRTILWENRRRFNNDVLRNVSEDLAECAGERGPVSVRQQLQILSRMSRTYKFMKVEYGSMIG